MPTCGRCKKTQVSSASIRACYNGESEAHGDLVGALPVAETDNSPMWPASDGQIKYVLDLQRDRVLPSNYKVKDEATLRGMEKDEVSSDITMLKTFTVKSGHNQGRKSWSMPEGRYALRVNGEVWFFEVNKPEKGKWAGYTFIKRLVGAPGSYRKLPMPAAERDKYLAKIDADPKAAAIMFGVESETCFRCHSPLTDPDSIARSMGPICAGKVGW